MRLNLFLIYILVSCTLFSKAQNYSYTHLWGGAVPGATTTKHPPIFTGTTDATIVYTDINDPTYVVYKPTVSNNNGCGIIVCSGGGYHQISTMSDIAAWLNGLGFTAFTLQYRVPTNQRAGVAAMDIQRAVRMIRSKSGEYGINPNKLGVMGLSAGGNLCVRACTRFNIDEYPKDKNDTIDLVSSRPDYAVLLYPAYLDLNTPITSGIVVNDSTPPIFHCVAMNDSAQYNSSVVLNAALKSTKANFEYHVFSNGGHGFIFTGNSDAVKQWPGLAKIWLNNIIKTNVLPVDLLSIHATSVENRFITVSWVTDTKTKNNLFEIERSVDGTNFYKIGQVVSSTTIATSQTYHYDDYGVIAGSAYYYRLRIISKDGDNSTTKVVNANFNKAVKDEFLTYPNPSKSYIVIESISPLLVQGYYQVIIKNILGQEVFQSRITSLKTKIANSVWGGSGIYFVNIINKNGAVIGTKQIIKQ